MIPGDSSSHRGVRTRGTLGVLGAEAVQPRQPRRRRLQRHRVRFRRPLPVAVLLHRQPSRVHKIAQVR